MRNKYFNSQEAKILHSVITDLPGHFIASYLQPPFAISQLMLQ